MGAALQMAMSKFRPICSKLIEAVVPASSSDSEPLGHNFDIWGAVYLAEAKSPNKFACRDCNMLSFGLKYKSGTDAQKT